MLTKAEIYRTANVKWGTTAQLLVALEELAELQKAICKMMNRGGSIKDVNDEMADVEIMLEQIQHIFWNDCGVKAEKKRKLDRLAKKLGLEGETELESSDERIR